MEGIKNARKKKGWTQEQLASAIGVKRSVISKYETGIISPTIIQIEEIANALNVSMPELLAGSFDTLSYQVGTIYGQESQRVLNKVVGEFWNGEGYSGTDEELKLVHSFAQLNEEGQQKAVERVQELTEIPRYRAIAAPEPPSVPTRDTDRPAPRHARKAARGGIEGIFQPEKKSRS